MKKTLIALAALAATASYAQTTVEVYGRAHLGYDATYKTTGGTTVPGGVATSNPTGAAGIAAGNTFNLANRARVADDGSRVGFRVREEMDGGVYARAVIETGVNLDTNSANGQSGAANSGTGFFGSRDAYVGLGNAMGEIRMGRQNNFWSDGAIEDVGANRLHFTINGMYTAPSSGWIAAPASRVDNTLKFVANQGLAGAFAGTEIWVAKPNAAEQAAPNTAITNISSTGVNGNQSGAVLAKASGFTLKFNQGPFAVQYDTAKNQNILNGVVTTTPTASAYTIAGFSTTAAAASAENSLKGTKLGLAYTYAAGSKVYFINSKFEQTYPLYANTVYLVVPAASNSVPLASSGGNRKQSNNQLGVQHRMGAWEFHAVYVNQGNVTLAGADLADSGSKAYTLGARYELSKRTAVTVSTTEIKNGINNNINNSGGGQSSVPAIGFGAKLTQMGTSIQHNF